MKTLLQRLEALETARTPVRRRIESLADLIGWAGNGGEDEEDVEFSEPLLRLMALAREKEAAEGGEQEIPTPGHPAGQDDPLP